MAARARPYIATLSPLVRSGRKRPSVRVSATDGRGHVAARGDCPTGRSAPGLPDVSHTAAIRHAAPEYERHVTAFFDDALAVR
jgi:hypothetical protein